MRFAGPAIRKSALLQHPPGASAQLMSHSTVARVQEKARRCQRRLCAHASCSNLALTTGTKCSLHKLLESGIDSNLKSTVLLLLEAGFEIAGVDVYMPCVGTGCDHVRTSVMPLLLSLLLLLLLVLFILHYLRSILSSAVHRSNWTSSSTAPTAPS